MNLPLVFGLTFLYFIFILSCVLYARYKATKTLLPSINEFFLASSNLGPLVLTCTYVASVFSTFSILGMPGLVYAHGVSGLYFLAIADVLGLTLLVIIGKRLHRSLQNIRIFSPLEAISHAYKSEKLGLLMALVFTLALLPYIALQLVGIGAFIDAYSGGRIDYVSGVGSMMVIVLLYLFLGGMRAVAYTDFIQIIAMALGLMLSALFLCNHYDLHPAAMFADIGATSPMHLHAPGAKGHFQWLMTLTTGLVTVGVFIQPHLLTRALMAKKEQHINTMVVGTIIGRLITVIFALFFGIFAFNAYGGDLKPNLMMGEVFSDLSRLGMIGLILSVIMLMGALGAAMSTADSLLISIGQISTRDMIRPFFDLSPTRQVMLSKAIMFGVLVFSFIIGLNPPKYMTDLAVYSGAISALMIPTFLSFTWGKRSLLFYLNRFIKPASGDSFETLYRLSNSLYPYRVHTCGFIICCLLRAMPIH